MIMKCDYSPLTDLVTKQDIDEYKDLYKFPKNLAATITPIVFLAIMVLIITFFYKWSIEVMVVLLFMAICMSYFVSRNIININKLRQYRLKLWKFAVKNNINYQAENHNISYEGKLFLRGENRYSYDILNYLYSENHPVEIANYRYDIRSSSTDSEGHRTSSTRTYRQGYVLINLYRKLPHIILDSKKNGIGSIGNSLLFVNQNQRLELEGDFNNYFDLYVPNGYERDALYIFTPDVMAVFVDETCNFDAEIIDDKLFIYSRGPFNLIEQSVLETLFKLIDLISNKTLDQSQNYADERVLNNRQENTIASEGKRLKFGLPKPIMVIIIIIVVFNVLGVILSVLPR